MAGFVDGKIRIIHQFPDLLQVIFQGYGEAVLMGGAKQKTVIRELLPAIQREAGFIGIAIHIVRIDPVAAFFSSQFNAVRHALANIQGADIQPAFSRPVAQPPTLVGGQKTVAIRAPVFVGPGGKIADHLFASGLQVLNNTLFGIEQIHHIEIYVIADVDLTL